MKQLVLGLLLAWPMLQTTATRENGERGDKDDRSKGIV